MEPQGLLARMTRALRCLPGVGPKSAQRMTFYLLQRDREGARQLALAVLEALDKVGHCVECRTLTEAERCAICSDPRRERSLLCVVETPAEADAINEGRFFCFEWPPISARRDWTHGIAPGSS